jgi:hypothetical protein
MYHIGKGLEMLRTTTIIVLREIEVNITAEVTPITTGKYSGPPEYCYPAEPGDVEIIQSTAMDQSVMSLTDEEEEEAKDMIWKEYLIEKANADPTI